MPPGPEGGAIGTSKNILELAITSKYLKVPPSIWGTSTHLLGRRPSGRLEGGQTQ